MQHVTKPTHQHGNILDLVITNSQDDSIHHIDVENSHISDHFSVIFTINSLRPHRQQKLIKYRKTRSIVIDDFREDIRRGLEKVDHENSTIIDHVEHFHNILRTTLDKHAPICEKKITIRPDSRWFTDNIRDLKKKRRHAEKVWRASKLDADREKYVQLRRDTNNAIVEAKRGYIRSNIIKHDGNSKEIFKIVHGLIRDEQDVRLPSRTEDLGSRAIANEFGHYFTDKIETIRNGLDQCNTTHMEPESALQITPESLTLSNFHPTSVEEVAHVIMKSPSKSCELDPIPTWLLKECIEEVARPIASIINKSFVTSLIPTEYKEAHVFPMLKKPSLDHEQLKNYRPVSNLNFVSKVMEKIVAKRLHEHLSKGDFGTAFQSAYKVGHSTETALLRVYNDAVSSLHAKNNVPLLLLDLSAAFDTIDHHTLHHRLQTRFNVTGPALDWIKNYLSNRTMAVTVNGELSAPLSVNYGVPQGSVLGPILFTLYTAPLEDIMKTHRMSFHLYADDTQIYMCIDEPSASESKSKLEACVEEIRSWMTANKLKLNDEKTELVVFHKPRTELLIEDVKVGSSRVHNSPNVRNLGFTLDETLSLKDHVTRLCRNIHYHLKTIGYIRNMLDENSARLVVHALVTSRIDYCNSLLFGLPNTLLKRIQKLQNKAARLVTNTKTREHITPVLKSLHWLPVEFRIKFKMACLAYKCIHGTAPPYLSSLLSLRHQQRLLRSSSQILLDSKIPTTSFSSRAFVFAAPTTWNALSNSTRNCTTFEAFRSKLKTELFKQAF